MQALTGTSAIFFDVDGVLINSLAAKADAFADLFPPGMRDRVREFHFANGGMNRIEKIARMSAEIGGISLSEVELHDLVTQYADAVRDRVVSADEIPGAEEALKSLTVIYPLHAVSAVPSDELEFVLSRRGLLNFFDSIHGVPPSKSVVLHKLLELHGYEPRRCVFVGDSIHDHEAAKSCGIPFIYIQSFDQPVPPGSIAVLPNLQDLECVIRAMLEAR